MGDLWNDHCFWNSKGVVSLEELFPKLVKFRRYSYIILLFLRKIRFLSDLSLYSWSIRLNIDLQSFNFLTSRCLYRLILEIIGNSLCRRRSGCKLAKFLNLRCKLRSIDQKLELTCRKWIHRSIFHWWFIHVIENFTSSTPDISFHFCLGFDWFNEVIKVKFAPPDIIL